MLDLEPATRELARIVRHVADEQLSAPTPCAEMSVADLLDHIDGLAVAFTLAAEKAPPATGDDSPAEEASPAAGWRSRIPERLDRLAAAWRQETAWTGMTAAGGVDLPGEVAGVVALNEVVVHGWDVAAGTCQPFTSEPQLIEAALGFVRSAAEENPAGSPGLFGPPVPVPADAPPLGRLIALSGRDPEWTSPST